MFQEDESQYCLLCEKSAKDLAAANQRIAELETEIIKLKEDKVDSWLIVNTELEERLGEAEGLLNEAAHAGNLTPGGWLQLQLTIAGFLTPGAPATEPLPVSRSQQRRLAIQKASPPREPDHQPE